MHIYIYTHIHIHVHICICTVFLHTSVVPYLYIIDACAGTLACTYLFPCVSICMHTYAYKTTGISMHVTTCITMCTIFAHVESMHACMQTNIYIYIYIYKFDIHTHMQNTRSIFTCLRRQKCKQAQKEHLHVHKAGLSESFRELCLFSRSALAIAL